MYKSESKIMRKLLGKATPDASSGDTPSSISASYRPIKSQNAVYPLSVPISCFDVSEDRRAVVLGGPHVLKTVVLDSAEGPGFNVSEGVDIRAAITSHKTSGARASIVSDQLNIRDVKYHGNSRVFTACATGRVFAYDLARIGTGGSERLELIQTQEDSRQVNSLDVNPHLRSWLLSGSQDGIARVFDTSAALPTRSGILTFRQRFSPLKSNDPIRQVAWSPSVGHELACCTEAGVILKWDVRQPGRPLLRINAHEKACSAIAWHPDGRHLISAGWDAKIHVWDFSKEADKRQKPKWTISTPAPVSAMAWRPGLWSATGQTTRTAQVAVSYDETVGRRYGSSVVHIWDFARPAMPYKEIERFDTSPAALLWRDQDMLWTVGQDGLFNQCDAAFAPKVIDRHSTSAMAFSPQGDVMMFLDERTQGRRPQSMLAQSELETRYPYSSSPQTPILSGSRSDSEEDVMASFLGPQRRTAHRRRLSNRPMQSMSTTPPSGSNMPEDSDKPLDLEQSINVTGTFKTPQTMAWGHLPAAKTAPLYQFMSGMYLEILARDLPFVESGKTLVQRVSSILEQFAAVAEQASLFRLSQTWRILAFSVAMLLNKRGQYHLDLRLSRFQKIAIDNGKGSSRMRTPLLHISNGEETPRRPSTQAGSVDGRMHGRSLLAEEIESTSNVPTPVARPVDSTELSNFDSRFYQLGRKLTPIIEPESLKLGPAVVGSFAESSHGSGKSTTTSGASYESGESQQSITEGYDFYDTEALSQAIDVPSSKATTSEEWSKRAKVNRQNSDDSYNQMFSISDGTKRDSLAGYSSSQTNSMEQAEYHRRMRGEHTQANGGGSQSRHRNSNQSVPDSPEAVFMISQTTASTDGTYPSQTPFASQSDSDAQPSFHTTLGPENRSTRADSLTRTAPSFRHDPSPHITESDYLPWDDDPDFQDMKGGQAPPAALNPYTVISRALAFETRSSAINASALVLLLKPLVPKSVIDSHQARGILRQQHNRLMSMGLFVEAALLRNMCVQGWPTGMPEWGENYPSIFSTAQQAVKIGFFCSSCQKPREIDVATDPSIVWTCERCHAVMAPCAICNHRESEIPCFIPREISTSQDTQTWLSEWWYCPGCGHGGHASCLQSWHSSTDDSSADKYSEGCCPLDGCGHACLPGKYRGETTTARADELGRAAVDSSKTEQRHIPSGRRRSSPSASVALGDWSVRSDSNDVPQSKAVGMAREALNKGSSPMSGSGNSTGGILSSSPGRIPGTGERERRKSVKFAKSE